jgi:DNA-binding response OmpR family regulator
MRILVVEENIEFSALLTSILYKDGFSCDVAASSFDAEEALRTTPYAVVVLDLALPDEDGLILLKRLRLRGVHLPVLILTSRADVEDRVKGLRAGADDYLVKPVAAEELVARLQALLRRPSEILGRRLQVGDLALDVEARQLFVAGRPENFSAREIDLLELMLRRVGRVVKRRYVEDHLFGLQWPVGSNAIEVAVHRLRKHLQALDAGAVVHTVKGVGYFITEVSKDEQKQSRIG